MIKHTLFFSFRPDVTQEQRRLVLDEQSSFPKVFPWMKNFSVGKNISERDKTFEYALSIEFDSEEDLHRYLKSPEHEAHVLERFRPLIAARAIVSFVPGKF